MVEQAEFLEHDADVTPHLQQRILVERGGVLAEQGDATAGRTQRQQQQFEQRSLAGPRGASEEMERAGFDAEIEIAEDLGPLPIAQADIGELDHRAIRSESVVRHHNSGIPPGRGSHP